MKTDKKRNSNPNIDPRWIGNAIVILGMIAIAGSALAWCAFLFVLSPSLNPLVLLTGPPEPSKGQIFRRGKLIQMGDVVYSVSGESETPVDEDNWSGPQLLSIDVSFKNTGNKPVEIRAGDFTFLDAEGATHVPKQFNVEISKPISSITVAPNQLRLAQMLFTVPKNSKGRVLTFSPSWAKNAAVVNFD